MSREIRFRGKRIDNGVWVYGLYFQTPLTDENSGTKPDAGWFFLCGEKRDCIVQNGCAFVIDVNSLGQYTGLKDRNGKEIYEGDIFVPRYNRFGPQIVKYKDGKYDICEFNLKKCEVIGNIYENKEVKTDDQTSI